MHSSEVQRNNCEHKNSLLKLLHLLSFFYSFEMIATMMMQGSTLRNPCTYEDSVDSSDEKAIRVHAPLHLLANKSPVLAGDLHRDQQQEQEPAKKYDFLHLLRRPEVSSKAATIVDEVHNSFQQLNLLEKARGVSCGGPMETPRNTLLQNDITVTVERMREEIKKLL